MGLSACPCMNLQKGCMILAIFDAVISMLNLGLIIIPLVRYINDDDSDLEDGERTAGIIAVIILIVICILQILLAFRLYIGARSKNYRNCRYWILVTAIITGLNIANFVFNIAASEFEGVSFSSSLINILYKIYEMFVVYQFLRELRLEGQMGITSYATVVHPQRPPQHLHYNPAEASHIYVTTQSLQPPAYPMQQYGPASALPPPPYSSYPAPVHHVTTTTRIS